MKKLNSIIKTVVNTTTLVLSLGFVAFAQEAPPIPKEVTIVNSDQLKKMLDGKEKFLLVDARNGAEFKEGHITTAIHVYDKEMDANKAKFPADKNTPIVFYCNGYPKCPRSVNAATTALGWGYKKIYVYAEGFPEWEKRGHPIER
jgi:rhodanese-related sulfurtransferase